MPALSFVLLSKAVQVDAKKAAATYAELFPGEEAPEAKQGDIVELTGERLITFVALMPAPVPNREADEAAARSLAALGAGFTAVPHHAHLLVTTMGEKFDTGQLALHTRRVAAVAKAAGAVAVYEGNAHATHPVDFYVEAAAASDVPVMVWNGLSVARTGATVELLSLGMSQLELPDLLLVAPTGKSGGAIEFFFNLLTYIVRRGTAIPDGETVGRTAQEKLPVRYVKSPIDAKVKVAQVTLS